MATDDTYQPQYGSMLTSRGYVSDDSDEDDSYSPHNYVTSTSNHEGLGCYVKSRPCVGWCSPAKPSCNAMGGSNNQKAQPGLRPPPTKELGVPRSLSVFEQEPLQTDQTGFKQSIEADKEADYGTHQRQLAVAGKKFVPTDLGTRSERPPALGERIITSTHGEPSRSLPSGPLIPNDIDRDCLKKECWIGIGSWSKDEVSSRESTQDKSVPSEIYAMFDKDWLAGTSQRPSGQQRRQSCYGSQSQSSSKPRSSTLDHNNFENLPEEDPDDDDIPERIGPNAVSEDGDGETLWPRLACPFNKHDPQFFSVNKTNGVKFRCCAGPGFENIARVKAHLYRLHKTPLKCALCQGLFNTQELLEDHLRSRVCDIMPRVSLKSITNGIEKRLKTDKKKNLPPAERWREIYTMIFPNDVVPSPYWDPSDSISPPSSEVVEAEDHESFTNRELSAAFRETLDVVLQGQLPPSRDELKSLLVASLSNCQRQVSSRYHTRQAALLPASGREEAMTTPTPTASSTGFDLLPGLPYLGIDAFNMQETGFNTTAPCSWHKTYQASGADFQPSQYAGESESSRMNPMDLPRSHARDSGYGSTSMECHSNCSGCYTCYRSADMSHSSFDMVSGDSNFANGLGLLQDSHDSSTMGTGSTTSAVLTSIPRNGHNAVSMHFNSLL